MSMKSSIYEWRTCYLCSGQRFLNTPSGNLLCPFCEGDGSLYVLKTSMIIIPENLLKAIESGEIKE